MVRQPEAHERVVRVQAALRQPRQVVAQGVMPPHAAQAPPPPAVAVDEAAEDRS